MHEHDSVETPTTPLETFLSMWRRYCHALMGLGFACKPATLGVLNYRYMPDHAETKLGLAQLALQSVDMAVKLLPNSHAIPTAHAKWLMARLGHPYHGVQPAHIRGLTSHHLVNFPADPSFRTMGQAASRMHSMLCQEVLGRAAIQDAIALTCDEPDPLRPSAENAVRDLFVDEMGFTL